MTTQTERVSDERRRLATMLAGMLDLNDDDMAQPITSDILVNPYEAADYIIAALASPAPAESGEPVGYVTQAAIDLMLEAKPGSSGYHLIFSTPHAKSLPKQQSADAPIYLHPPAESAGSPSTSGVGVTIKPLEWVRHPSAELWRADSLIGRHQVYAVISQIDWAYDGWDGITRTSGDASSIEAAKAACQADYEARIRSALSAAPTSGVGVTWQPIETAPMDGRMIHLWNSAHDEQVIGGWTNADALGMDEGGWTSAGGKNQAAYWMFNPNYFQMWRPLPAAPSDHSRDTQPALLSTDETQEGGNG